MTSATMPAGRSGLPLLLVLLMVTGSGAAVGAQSPSAATVDACALLSDEEVFAASGAVAIVSTHPVSSFGAVGYGGGCTRDLEPVGGLPEDATLRLDYGLQLPGGRGLYEGQRQIMPNATRVGGLGDEAFQGLSREWYAVKGDATIVLDYVGIGAFDPSLRRGGLVARALTWLLMSRLPGDPSPGDVTGPVCVLDTAQVDDLVGRPFVDMSAGGLNCLYHGDPATGAYALDIRLEDPSPPASDADLGLARMDSGEATVVRGLPAWTSDEALWVDVGRRLLVVQPMFDFSDGLPPVRDVTIPIAEQVIDRLPSAMADPTPEPTPIDDQDLESLFPSELRGAPVSVQSVAGADLLAQASGPVTEAFLSVVTGQGRTIDDLSIGLADLFNAADRDGRILAIRLRGADAATFGIPLLLATQGAPDLPIGREPATLAGKDVLVLDLPGTDAAHAVHAYAHGDIAWFVSATTCVTYTPERGCEAESVDRPLLEEILAALP